MFDCAPKMPLLSLKKKRNKLFYMTLHNFI